MRLNGTFGGTLLTAATAVSRVFRNRLILQTAIRVIEDTPMSKLAFIAVIVGLFVISILWNTKGKQRLLCVLGLVSFVILILLIADGYVSTEDIKSSVRHWLSWRSS